MRLSKVARKLYKTSREETGGKRRRTDGGYLDKDDRDSDRERDRDRDRDRDRERDMMQRQRPRQRQRQRQRHVTTKAAMTDEKYVATNKPSNDEAGKKKVNGGKEPVQQRQLKSGSAADNTTKANMVDVTEDVANNITVKVGEAIIATQNIIVDISDAPLDFDKPLLSKRSKDTCIHRQRSPRKSVSPRKLRKETRDCRSRSPLKHDDRKEARNHRSESPHELEYHKETRNHSSRSSRKHDHRDETRDHRCAPRYYHDRRESRRYYEYY